MEHLKTFTLKSRKTGMVVEVDEFGSAIDATVHRSAGRETRSGPKERSCAYGMVTAKDDGTFRITGFKREIFDLV